MSSSKRSKSKEAEEVKSKSKDKHVEKELDVEPSRPRKIKRSNTESSVTATISSVSSRRTKDDSEFGGKSPKSRSKPVEVEVEESAPESTFCPIHLALFQMMALGQFVDTR
jgi:PAB1-binding protein PBP1